MPIRSLNAGEGPGNAFPRQPLLDMCILRDVKGVIESYKGIVNYWEESPHHCNEQHRDEQETSLFQPKARLLSRKGLLVTAIAHQLGFHLGRWNI